MFLPLLFLPLTTALPPLRLAASLNTIEHAPLFLTLQDFYPSNYTILNGGVPNLLSTNNLSTRFDLAANAETQGLLNYARDRDLRLIYIIVEATYRLIANNSTGTIHSIADLKGKTIATSGTASAGYFVQRMLQTGGIKPGEYTIPTGLGGCLKTPCPANSHPALLARGEAAAVGMWEPLGELSIDTIGRENAVVWKDKRVYREIYGLYSMKATLEDKEKRKGVVEFVRGLQIMLRRFEKEREKAIPRVSRLIGVTEDVLGRVWGDHSWVGGFPEDLVDVLVEEDEFVARLDNRTVMKREEVQGLVDLSVWDEVLRS
ncbi:hypothetical protein OQA88_2246 [Cercophora sp. LCS_1]